MQFLYNILNIISHLFMIKHKHLLSMIFKKDNKRTLIYYTYKWEASNRLTKKNQTDFFFNDMINIKNFDSSLLKIDKKS